MKLIIDIPEEAYNACLKLKSNDDEGVLGFCLINATANGTPLEEELENYWICVNDRLPNKDGYYDVINIRGEKCKYVFNTQGNSKEYWRRCALLWNPLSHKEGE